MVPAVLVIHGGGWTTGDKAEEREVNIATNLVKAGYIVLSINYVRSRPVAKQPGLKMFTIAKQPSVGCERMPGVCRSMPTTSA